MKWAKSIANMSDDRWAKILLLWEPREGSRAVGHPELRWDDRISKMFASNVVDNNRHDWLIYAMDAETWDAGGARYMQP